MPAADNPSTSDDDARALFAPRARQDERLALADKQHPDGHGRVTLLATGETLLPAPIKVAGSMSAAAGADGTIAVHTNYVFAYPFTPSDPSSITASWQIVAVEHIAQDFTWINGTGYTSDSQGLFLAHFDSYGASIDCRPFRAGYLAPAYEDQDYHPAAGDDPDALYDPNHPLGIPDTCDS